MAEDDRGTILVIGRRLLEPVVDHATTTRGGFEFRPDGRRQSAGEYVAVGTLQANFEKTLSGLREVLSSATTPISGLSLDSLEINLEVTADGKVGFLGTGTSLTGKAGITLKFERSKQST